MSGFQTKLDVTQVISDSAENGAPRNYVNFFEEAVPCSSVPCVFFSAAKLPSVSSHS